jgi:hypothetical protein
MNGWDPAQLELVDLLPRIGRGPRREGVYALWLVLRVAQDLMLEPPLAERAVRRRLAGLEVRLSSLTLPPPLRRALTATLQQLRDGGASMVPLVLSTLVAPARETAGPEAGEAIQHAARAARQSAPNPSR